MKTNSLFKRLVSMLIVVLMICTLFPVTALAWDPPQPDPSWKPAKPTYNDLKSLLKVQIQCTNSNAGHEDFTKTYDLLDNSKNKRDSFKANDVQWDLNLKKYTCTVEIYSARYVAQYDRDTGATHTPKNDNKTITLVCNWEGGMYGHWTYSLPQGVSGTITFNVGCEDEPEKVTLTYNDNGGTGGPGSVDSSTIPATFIVSGTEPSRPNYSFLGWADSADSTRAVYVAGSEITTSSNKTIYAVWQKTPPSLDELNALLEVEIDCDKHDDEDYPLEDNHYTITGPTLIDGEWKCSVTIRKEDRDYYIEKYNGEVGKAHTPKAGEAESKTVTLVYTDNGWELDVDDEDDDDDKYEIEFEVECDGTPTPPTKPGDDTVKGLLANSTVTIDCSVKTSHADATYGLLEGSYQIGEVTGNATEGYECTVTVNSAKYIEEYNKTNAGHKAVATDLPSRTITLKYTDGAWTVKSGSAPVVFCVECESPAPAPKQPVATDLPQILWSEAVKIHCSVKTSHADATYGLLEGSYDIGDVTEKDGVYICEITVYPTLYVNTYNEYTGVIHKLDPDNQVSATITLIYVDNYGWDVARAERSTAPAFTGVTFNVVCEETPVTTYTVTYKDGVGGKVFKDDVHTVKSGATTPAFVGGIPTRPGYVFVGWTPAVSGTVKGNATYTATWRKVKDTTVIEIGGGNSSSSSSKEENPNTGAPVFVGVSVGALAAAK